MSQIIKSEGLRVLFTGSLHDYTRREARAALELAGGKTCYEAKHTFDVAVIGRRPGKADMEIVTRRGKPQLDEAQFKRLVQFGELDLKGAPRDEISAGESVGELRGIFDGDPSPKMWRDVVAVLDQTEPERLSEVVSYVEGHVSRWPIDEARARHASIVQAKLPESSSWVGGDLRVMPPHWVAQLLEGEDSEKFSVARAISLEGTKAKASAASKIFNSSHIGQLRHFDCGRDLKLTKTFFKKMAQCEAMSNLETLVYYPYKKSGAGAELAKGEHFDSLAHLKIRYADYGIDHDEGKKDLQDLFAADWIGQIQSLESSMGGSPKVSCSSALMQEDVLGELGERLMGLNHLILVDAVYAKYSEPYREVFARAEELGVVGRAYPHHKYPSWQSAFHLFEAFAMIKDKRLHTIDLSQLMVYEHDRRAASQKKMIGEFVKERIARQIKRVVVNEHATEATCEALAKLDGVEVIKR